MAHPIVVPRLGLTMESGQVVEWHISDGESVTEGQLLFALETDKAVQEVEAPTSGVVYIRPDLPDGALPIGTLLGYIAAADEAIAWPEEVSTVAAQAAATATASAERAAATDEPAARRASPAARRRAAELGINWHDVPGSSREGYVLEADVETAAIHASVASESTPLVTPVARRAAADLGVDIDALARQMPGQRITRTVVEHAAQSTNLATSALVETRQPLTSIRRLIAERMSAGVQAAAPVTLTTEVDATELVRLRHQLKNDAAQTSQPVPAYTDLLAKIVARALAEHPLLNARLEADSIVVTTSVHIGLAVDTERGLLVPVLRDVQVKGLRQVAAETSDLVERAQAGRLRPDEMRGGTFTISNLGMYDIDAFTPILNLPECAILGVGRIVPKQIVVEHQTDRLAIRQMLFLSLTFDHRIVDGGPAARFLQRIKQFVEQPYLWLVD